MPKKNTPRPSSSDISPEPELRREVVFNPRYERERAKICGSLRAADDFLRGLEIFLSRRPELGYAFRFASPANALTYFSKLLPWGERIRVMYVYDDQRVTMLSAWPIPGATEDRYP